MPRRGSKRIKTRTHVEQDPAVQKKDPKCFIIKRGRIDLTVSELIDDLRATMSPNTAQRLKERRKNTLKDFVSVAGPLGVTHMMLFSQSASNLNLRMCRLPKGPTLTFQITSYTPAKHVKALQRHPVEAKTLYQSPPMLVLNNFQSPEKHLKVVTALFQTMFPTIDLDTFKISSCRRIVLVNYDEKSKTIQWRHYAIRANPVGVSRSVKKLNASKVPNLNKLEDISDFVLRNGAGVLSESEFEDETSHVVLPQKFAGKGNTESKKSAIRLVEMGPRMDMKLIKIEQEIGGGDVLYHEHVHKDPADAAALKARRLEKESLKKARREEQEANVAKKKADVKAKKEAKAERRKLREMEKEATKEELDDEEVQQELEGFEHVVGEQPNNESSDDDNEEVEEAEQKAENSDEEWYEREVGEAMRPEDRKRPFKKGFGRGRGRGMKRGPRGRGAPGKRRRIPSNQEQKPGGGIYS